ncbi:hypothetical protein AUK04_01390 [Candidatus Roizmanbacteria bacterium CG2_30_33_16]|uniref:Thioredoxin domain-containing protein n=2 Tax=Candidatus Roizmaniibacteriota TaxID=1752723 RepID=A0A1J5HIY6_9BACT|nr:MAG: hypothetical protein AUK04_01390 [Candidatus Roizmanbacteria bacterium CG2_30_33_16]
MQNNLLKIIATIFISFIFLYLIYLLINKPAQTYFPEINVISKNDLIKWSPDKKNVLIEYSDFQCPACKNFHDFLQEFESSSSANFPITKKVTLIFRHFPLQIHSASMDAAYAAEAAALQGRFWEMDDQLFGKQDIWSTSTNPRQNFINMASEIKLDIEKFKSDMDSKVVKNKVQADLASGNKAEINSTPTFFLNGNKIELTTLDEFKKLLLK